MTAQLKYLHTLLSSFILLGNLDSLEGTVYYKMALKSKVKSLIPELVKVIDDDLDDLWSDKRVDPKLLYRMLRAQESFVMRAALIDPTYYPVINEMLDQWMANPELVQKQLDINVIQCPEPEESLR